ncbi:NUDIX hydrolase [Gymnodinialimonas sp. 2305UL16-5]|uniref:NUDIX hydrolase n=1 Tax=Gymnodinialimonas mytili TaxID=3126503 RepID=UPI00309B86E0
MSRPIRLAVRGLLLVDNRLMLVNAWPGGTSDLLCAPGGGVEPHSSLHDNLIREFHEETGLDVSVGPVCLVNEFHDPPRDYHQVDIYFRVTLVAGNPLQDWTDPEGIVTERYLLSRDELATRRVKPDSLADVTWGTGVSADGSTFYDVLERSLR